MVLFVGDKPSKKNADPRVPFVGTKSYTRLLNWIDKMGIDITHVSLANQTDVFLATQNCVIVATKGKTFKLKKEDKVVALGLAASKGLESLGVHHFRLPHPSGLNRQNNDKTFIEQQLNRCMEFLDAYSHR